MPGLVVNEFTLQNPHNITRSTVEYKSGGNGLTWRHMGNISDGNPLVTRGSLEW